MLWAKDIYDRLISDELAKNVPDAEKLLEQHQERKVHDNIITLTHHREAT